MIQNFTALNTMYRKNAWKQPTFRSLTGTEKQIDYILVKRRHLKYNKDAEANGSDHRCVMATFVINAETKNWFRDDNNDKQRTPTMRNIRARIGKEDVDKEVSMFEERYQELEEEIKHEAVAEKSNLKPNKDRSTTETTEAGAEKERKGMQ